MSDQESETSAEHDEEDGLERLQESELDSVTGGGNPQQPLVELQDSRPDTVEKSDDADGHETKESSSDSADSRDGSDG